jgi:hypothetical protein
LYTYSYTKPIKITKSNTKKMNTILNR